MNKRKNLESTKKSTKTRKTSTNKNHDHAAPSQKDAPAYAPETCGYRHWAAVQQDAQNC